MKGTCVSPTIRVDQLVYRELQKRAMPFVDTPNSVLRRVLELPATEPSPKSTDRLAKGSRGEGTKLRRGGSGARKARAASEDILSETEYELPLLKILDERGGRAPAGEVIEELGGRLRSRLTSADQEQLPSGGVRWKNRAQFVRLRLVEAGDLETNTPRGIWAISGKGRKRLAG